LEQGPVEQDIIKQAFLMRMPVPEKIRNAPQLRLGLELYLEAFYDLNSCRPAAWGIAPIPWTAMRDYADAYDFEDDQRERLMRHVPLLDQAFRRYHEDRKPKT
jgi:hypothetical protein